MAKYVLPIAGAVAGGFVGGAVGAQIGWVAGSLVGSMFSHSKVTSSMSPTTSEEGSPRPIVYGTGIVTGNVIDKSRVRTRTQKSSGKGGSASAGETKSMSFAVRICEGPIAGISRIWENETLVYDIRPERWSEANDDDDDDTNDTDDVLTDDDNADYADGFTLYLGDETQSPDPTLEGIHGSGNVPAYRGTAYIVFKNHDVTNTGGSVPSFRFEVMRTGTVTTTETHSVSALQDGYFAVGGTTAGGAAAGGSVLLNSTISSASLNGQKTCLYNIQVNSSQLPVIVTIDVGGVSFSMTISPGDATTYWYQINLNSSTGGSITAKFVGGSPDIDYAFSCGIGVAAMNQSAVAYGGVHAGTIDPADSDYFGIVKNDAGNYYSAPWGDKTVTSVTVTTTAESDDWLLGNIVADLADRSRLAAGSIDVGELTDSVHGLVLAQQYTANEAIDALRKVYLFDRSEYDGKIYFPKRGKSVVATLTEDDLTDDTDESEAGQALEYPRTINLTAAVAGSGYARAVATYRSSSPNVEVTGETSVESPVVMTADEMAVLARVLLKLAWDEARGTVTLSVTDALIGLVPGDCIGLVLRGITRRLRIDEIEYAEGVMKLTCGYDRQSAYNATATAIPLPSPTPTGSSTPGNTILAVLDIPALTDANDALGYYVAVTGLRTGWRGAQVQRSLDAGSDYSAVSDQATFGIVGVLRAGVTAASPYYTDTTNVVHVELYRDTDDGAIEAIDDTAFLSGGGAIALEGDSGWEVCQYRDVEVLSTNVYKLTTLHRGLLGTDAAAHASGQRLVLLSSSVWVDATSAMLGLDVYHRGVSYGQSSDDATAQDATYMGRTQRELAPAGLSCSAAGSALTATVVPHYRFGSDTAPVASANFSGFRWTLSDGSTTTTTDTGPTATTLTADVSAFVGTLTVSVAQLNRITGAGESISEQIEI